MEKKIKWQEDTLFGTAAAIEKLNAISAAGVPVEAIKLGFNEGGIMIFWPIIHEDEHKKDGLDRISKDSEGVDGPEQHTKEAQHGD